MACFDYRCASPLRRVLRPVRERTFAGGSVARWTQRCFHLPAGLWRNEGLSTQVSVHSRNSFFGVRQSFSSRESANVFIEDRNHGAAPPGAGGGPEVHVAWRSPEDLEISCSRTARVFLAVAKLHSVRVHYVRT